MVVRSQLYDSWNRWAFVCRRKDSSDEAALICAGRLFHAHAAVTGKARSPRVTRRVGGTSSVVVSAEWRWRATNSDVGRRLSVRYADTSPYVCICLKYGYSASCLWVLVTPHSQGPLWPSLNSMDNTSYTTRSRARTCLFMVTEKPPFWRPIFRYVLFFGRKSISSGMLESRVHLA